MSEKGPIENLRGASTARDLGQDLTRHLIVHSSRSATGFESLRSCLQEKKTKENSVEERKRHWIAPSSQATTGFKSLPTQENLENTTMASTTPAVQPGVIPRRTVDDPSNHGVYRLEDFLARHKAEQDARQQATLAAQNIPAEPTQFTSSGTDAARASTDATSLAPVAVGARSSKHIILLNDKCQALGLPFPSFEYTSVGVSVTAVELSFPVEGFEELQGVREEGIFNSKQQAKEAACKKVLAILEQLQEQGRVGVRKKNKDSGVGVEPQKVVGKNVPNYVGQLLEFQRATGSPQPIYNDYQSGTRFACLIDIEGHPEPFGSLTSLHSSKKAARHDAASHAIEYFKSIGTWPTNSTPAGGIKKPKSSAGVATPTTTTTSNKTSTPTTPSKVTPGTPSYMESYPSRVAQLATQLSLPCPEYIYTPHASEPNFQSVACFFRDAGPHAGPLGEVRNVFGRKRAKDECARLVLAYLEELKEQRLAYGRETMMAVRGSGGGGGGGGGEEIIEGGGKRAEKEVGASGRDDDDDGFEDAMETLPG